jgi:biopolymer transport protein ExbB/TolQ
MKLIARILDELEQEHKDKLTLETRCKELKDRNSELKAINDDLRATIKELSRVTLVR